MKELHNNGIEVILDVVFNARQLGVQGSDAAFEVVFLFAQPVAVVASV